MTKHIEMQYRLKTAIQAAILHEGKIDGTDDVALTNTDVVEALLEVVGYYASFHGFESYTPTDLAFKNATTIQRHIDSFRALRRDGGLKMNVVPRNKVN
ncbi:MULTISPECIES: hypothetical protein [Halocynthiibacter]|uniref:Uncharacterized protein n=1 Tax=Halocynthiibacter halioticoli TaxID=2986804 RepID=A0AAE3J1R4_9RHOB|nr:MULTISPECIES: hypothetical protein [Halocynthiibacter]MCV6825155.1 hypothetical protein [Halocynthiibacter halioticoli]MCW4058156.1 hypothetical protein [Halocynthiibacter sp. SDUM655004]